MTRGTTRTGTPSSPRDRRHAAAPSSPAGPSTRTAAAAAPAKQRPLAFLREFLKSPKELGTCFVSSPALSRAMVNSLGLETARCVVELGPGTGALTERILARIPRGCRFFAIERNQGLSHDLHARWPSLNVYHDDAANLRAVAAREGVSPGEVDCIVSSIPFLLFNSRLQARILREVAGMLRPGGGFVTLTYRIESLMPSVKRFRRLMENEFSQVRLDRVVLANVPPAFVYRCVR